MHRTRRPKGLRSPSAKMVREIIMQNLRDWNTPRSLAIFLILKYGKDSDFLSLKDIQPEWFNDPVSYAEFAYPTDLVRKSKLLDLGINTREAATAAFHEAEERCRLTNIRLRLSSDPTGRLGETLHRVRKIIRETLPNIDREALDELVELGGWGKGVTSSAKSRKGGKPNWLTFCTKLVSHQHSTMSLLPIARALVNTINGMSSTIEVKDYNEVAFVPKNAKTDRAIAVEPSINCYLQRGVGVLLRRALRRLGVDLIHGQDRNAAFAKRGSIDGSFATIDLSSASDTVSRKLIPYLFPPEWESLLSLLRTPYYKLDGKIKPYHKWSSMGNGYTFELESLIFSACARAVVGDGQFCVYGDDIIVPTEAVEDLASLLDHLGFVLNSEKSFTTGPFRESCGRDYFLGVAVRGLYLKDLNPVTLSVWHNWLAAERLLPVAHATLSRLRKEIGECAAPFPDVGAFWAPPFPDHANGLSRGYRHGRWGWYYNKVCFVPVARYLSKRDEPGSIATYCRLAMASEPIDRLRLEETLADVGKWVQRRVFIDDADLRLQLDTWPRG